MPEASDNVDLVARLQDQIRLIGRIAGERGSEIVRLRQELARSKRAGAGLGAALPEDPAAVYQQLADNHRQLWRSYQRLKGEHDTDRMRGAPRRAWERYTAEYARYMNTWAEFQGEIIREGVRQIREGKLDPDQVWVEDIRDGQRIPLIRIADEQGLAAIQVPIFAIIVVAGLVGALLERARNRERVARLEEQIRQMQSHAAALRNAFDQIAAQHPDDAAWIVLSTPDLLIPPAPPEQSLMSRLIYISVGGVVLFALLAAWRSSR